MQQDRAPKLQALTHEPKRRRPFRDRKSDARIWLERLLPGDLDTEARANELAAFVDMYSPGSAYHRIAEAMIRNHELPSLQRVKARSESRKAARQRSLERGGPLVEITPEVVEQLGLFIVASWAKHDRGPYWSEVRVEMNWDRNQTSDALSRLNQEKIIAYTRDRGSLTLITKH